MKKQLNFYLKQLVWSNLKLDAFISIDVVLEIEIDAKISAMFMGLMILKLFYCNIRGNTVCKASYLYFYCVVPFSLPTKDGHVR